MNSDATNTILYRANGKLLLSGEYLVLKGANALAVPTVFGQSMKITRIDKPMIVWQAFEHDNLWFKTSFSLPNFEVLDNSVSPEVELLLKVLKAAQKLGASFSIKSGAIVETKTDFNLNWGLGTSSTFIANVARWLNINPYKLNYEIFKGSGYDIACASSSKPVLYNLSDHSPVVSQVHFYPEFKDQLYFVWLNKKKNTRVDLEAFNKKYGYENEVKQVNDITFQMLNSKALDQFQQLIIRHENLIGTLINEAPVKQKLFPDFKGEIKSLGAWGGDFVLVATKIHYDKVKAYFNVKGYNTVLEYDEMVLKC